LKRMREGVAAAVYAEWLLERKCWALCAGLVFLSSCHEAWAKK
jgi:hypothetical protein